MTTHRFARLRRSLQRLRWPTLVAWIAIGLGLMTLGAVETWLHSSTSDPWRPRMTNVAPGAFFVALTITVIDGAIRRRDRARLAPSAARPDPRPSEQ